MNGVKGWTADEVSQEIKPYNKTKQNNISSSDCSIAETMKQPANQLPLKIVSGIITTAILLGVGGITTHKFLFAEGCDRGMQKIDGRCIDPYLQGYERLAAEGKKILEDANDYQNLAGLQAAQKKLARVVDELSSIPQDALVYENAKATLTEFDRQQASIYQLVETETKIEREIAAANKLADEAKTAASNAVNKSQLEAAKQKWQGAISKLTGINSQTIAAPQIERYKDDYQRQVIQIDSRIASLAKPTRVRTFKQVSPPPRKTVTPVKVRPQKIAPQPTTFEDPCAVEPQPANCIF